MTTAIDAPVFGVETEARLLTEFRRAAADVPAYRVAAGRTRRPRRTGH